MGAPEVVGGGEEGRRARQSPLCERNSGAPSPLKHIVHKSSSLNTLFHSVIYNSVLATLNGAANARFCFVSRGTYPEITFLVRKSVTLPVELRCDLSEFIIKRCDKLKNSPLG